MGVFQKSIVRICIVIAGMWFICLSAIGQCGISGTTIEITSDADWNLILDCDSIYGSLLVNHWDITDLGELSGVVWVEENLILDGNISLFNDAGLDSLKYVGGDLMFVNNFTLQHINSLGELQHVGGSMVFDGNITLVSVDSFGNLTAIDGDLVFRENHTLVSFNGLSNLMMVLGNVEFSEQNLVLNTLNGLQNLQSVGGNFYVSLPLATGLLGMEQLQVIGGNLEVISMPLCAHVDGLSSLQQLGGNLDIHGNNILIQVDALAGLMEVGGDMLVYNNPSLFLCCGLEPVLQSGGVIGIIDIQGNGSNCNNIQEILDGCEMGLTERSMDYSWSWSSEMLTVFTRYESELMIVDIQGKEIWRQHIHNQEEVRLPLCSGWYLMRIYGEKGSEVVRLIIP